MNTLRITRNTTNGEIAQFCADNPQLKRKIITAQARHERREKRIEHKYAQQEMEDGNYREN